MSKKPEEKSEGKPDPESIPLYKMLKAKMALPDWLAKVSAPDLVAQQQAFSQTQFCATLGCTNAKFSWCHAIPEQAQLAGIADEFGNAHWIPMRERERWTMKPWTTESPISQILVFRGFCNKCDGTIFKKIDQPLVLDDETYLLLAYRAACYANWRAHVDLRASELRPEKMKEILLGDANIPQLVDDFEKHLEPQIKEAQNHQTRQQDMMESVRDAVVSNNTDYLETMVFDLGIDIPIRYSVAASFTTSLQNEVVHVSQIECPPTPAVFLHLLDVDSTSKLIVSWPRLVPDRYPSDWLTKIVQYADSGHLADVLLRYMWINNHGMAIGPEFIPKLTHEQSSYLNAPLATHYYHGKRAEISRICDPPYFDQKWSIRQI